MPARFSRRRRARLFVALTSAFLSLVIFAPQASAVACMGLQYSTPAHTQYQVSTPVTQTQYASAGIDSSHLQYSVASPQYSPAYSVQSPSYTQQYQVQDPSMALQYSYQQPAYKTQYQVQQGSPYTVYAYQMPIYQTQYLISTFDHWIHHNNFRHLGRYGWDGYYSTSCAFTSWDNTLLNEGSFCMIYWPGWYYHNHNTDPPVYTGWYWSTYIPYNYPLNDPWGSWYVQYYGQTQQVQIGWTGVQYGTYLPAGAYLDSTSTAYNYAPPTWVDSLPAGQQGVNYLYSGTTQQVRDGWGPTINSFTPPSGTAGVDYNLVSTQMARSGWTNTHWTNTLPAGQNGVDYLYTGTTQWAASGWGTPYPSMTLPPGQNGVDYRATPIQTQTGFQSPTWVDSLPMGQNGVDYSWDGSERLVVTSISNPVWTTQVPSSFSSSSYYTGQTRTITGWSTPTWVDELPSGVNGVDYQYTGVTQQVPGGTAWLPLGAAVPPGYTALSSTPTPMPGTTCYVRPT